MKGFVYSYRKYILALIFLMFAFNAHAQLQNDPGAFFASGIHQDINGLVRNRTVLSGQYMVERRTFELGLLMSEFKAVSGFVFKHQYFLNKTRRNSYHPGHFNFRPYLLYHFVYNNHLSESFFRTPVSSEESFEFHGIDSPTYSINTIEHYFGIGMEVDLTDNLYFNSTIEAGIYFFRNTDRAVEIEDQLLPDATTGLTWNLGIGAGYRF